MATPLLYLAWRGREDDPALYWATFDGKSWSPQSTQSDRASRTGPSLAEHGDRLYMAWRGVTDDYGSSRRCRTSATF
jgi:hypothetical protein